MNNGEYVYETVGNMKACRNVVSITEILYGTGGNANIVSPSNVMTSLSGLDSKGVREGCLREALNCTSSTGGTATDNDEGYCLRDWKKPKATDE